MTIASIKSLVFGGAIFRDVRTNFTSAAATTENSDAVKGNLGMPILSQFHLVTDYTRDELWLTPLKADTAKVRSP